MKHNPPKNLAEDLDYFLRDLCVDWGFCNRLTGEQLLSQSTPVTADAFARAVLLAKGMNPDHEKAWLRKLKHAFADRFGNSATEKSFADNR
jgi:hypothetical protein